MSRVSLSGFPGLAASFSASAFLSVSPECAREESPQEKEFSCVVWLGHFIALLRPCALLPVYSAPAVCVCCVPCGHGGCHGTDAQVPLAAMSWQTARGVSWVLLSIFLSVTRCIAPCKKVFFFVGCFLSASA